MSTNPSESGLAPRLATEFLPQIGQTSTSSSVAPFCTCRCGAAIQGAHVSIGKTQRAVGCNSLRATPPTVASMSWNVASSLSKLLTSLCSRCAASMDKPSNCRNAVRSDCSNGSLSIGSPAATERGKAPVAFGPVDTGSRRNSTKARNARRKAAPLSRSGLFVADTCLVGAAWRAARTSVYRAEQHASEHRSTVSVVKGSVPQRSERDAMAPARESSAYQGSRPAADLAQSLRAHADRGCAFESCHRAMQSRDSAHFLQHHRSHFRCSSSSRYAR